MKKLLSFLDNNDNAAMIFGLGIIVGFIQLVINLFLIATYLVVKGY